MSKRRITGLFGTACFLVLAASTGSTQNREQSENRERSENLQQSVSGTWTGTVVSVGHGAPAFFTTTLTLTQQGRIVTGDFPTLSSGFEGVVTHQTDQAVFMDAYVTTTFPGVCAPTIFTGSLKVDLVQNTLVGNISGVNTDCLTEINRLTFQR